MGDALHPDINFVPKNELVNLTTTVEDHYEAGNSPDITMKAGKVKEALPLIRKFNRHSSLILSQSTENPVFTSVAIQKEIQLDDLEKHSDPRYESLNIPSAVMSQPASLVPEISKFPLQFDLKVPFESMSSSDIIPTLDDKPNAGQQIRQSSKCDRVLNIADELLRHFWASTTNKLRMESIRMHLQKINEEIDAVIKDGKQYQWTLHSIRTCVQHALQFKLDRKPPIS